MISIKSPREIELMRKSGMILSKLRQELEKHLKPGISTKELDNIAEKFIKDNGGIPSFKGYGGFTGSICASVNEVVVHGVPNSNVILKNGDIITLDLGVIYKGYHSDSAWTYAIGKVSDDILQLMEVTKNSLFKGLEQIKPGARFSDIGHAIEEYVKPFKYGIVEDFTGHGIGRKLHEDPYIPNYGPGGNGPIIREGMTMCIEPMINLGTKEVEILEDGWTTVTLDKKPSAHYEMMVVVTKDGYEILTPKLED